MFLFTYQINYSMPKMDFIENYGKFYIGDQDIASFLKIVKKCRDTLSKAKCWMKGNFLVNRTFLRFYIGCFCSLMTAIES